MLRSNNHRMFITTQMLKIATYAKHNKQICKITTIPPKAFHTSPISI